MPPDPLGLDPGIPSTGQQTRAEDELRVSLRLTISALNTATEAGVDPFPIILEELAAAGVELPPALAML